MKSAKKKLSINRKISFLIIYCLCFSFLIGGCKNAGAVSVSENSNRTYMYSEAADKMTWELPLLDDVDPGMSRAHFISAPEYVYNTDSYSKYNISYDMKVDDTSACFAISDGHGMYGDMILCELLDSANEDDSRKFFLSTSKNGMVDERIIGTSIDRTEDGVYHVEINNVNGNELSIKVNGEDAYKGSLSEIGYSGFNLGAIGTYKGRSQVYAYIDNIKVTVDDITIYDENFEGDTNIFSPYFTFVEDGWMRVESGFTLTEIKGAPAPCFRREFEIDNCEEVTDAILYLTALGAFDVSINGASISRDILDPGCLMFPSELKYVAYDVKNILDKNNVMDILLVHGWFDRGQGFPELASPWGGKLALKGELAIKYNNGEVEIIPTDELFKVTYDTSVRFDDIYQGEIIDDNYITDKTTWNDVEVDSVDSDWIKVPITAKENEPIRAIDEINPISETEPSPGVYVYDFGKNISGNIEINFSANKKIGSVGDVIMFRYGEILNIDGMANLDNVPGTIWTQNLLTARATDYYIAGDNTTSCVEFKHTIHGFRYLEIHGLKDALPIEDVKALVLSSEVNTTGEFSCEDEKVYALYNNSVNSIRANMLDNPSDCNQRDERLGWAGDAQNVSLMACYLFDMYRLYEKYLDTMVARQSDDGAFPDTAPSMVGGYGSNCWGDAPVVIAWNLYTMYGDKAVIEKYYEPCCLWVDYLAEHSNEFIRDDGVVSHSYGDHLSEQTTLNEVSDTAWAAHSADLVSKMAQIVGDNYGVTKYSDIFDNYRKAWNDRFIREDGSVEAGIMSEESETGYALGICFNLFDDSIIQAAADRLSILAEYSGYKFCPGYSGLSYLLPALSRYGHADTAMKILMQEGPRTLMNTVACQMTSLPETLDAYYFDDTGLLHIEGSLNHPAYASVCSFMYTDILGIQADENNPGFKHFVLKPIGEFGTAAGSLCTQYGSIEVSRDSSQYHVTIPSGTSATLTMPDGTIYELEAGSYSYNW